MAQRSEGTWRPVWDPLRHDVGEAGYGSCGTQEGANEGDLLRDKAGRVRGRPEDQRRLEPASEAQEAREGWGPRTRAGARDAGGKRSWCNGTCNEVVLVLAKRQEYADAEEDTTHRGRSEPESLRSSWAERGALEPPASGGELYGIQSLL